MTLTSGDATRADPGDRPPAGAGALRWEEWRRRLPRQVPWTAIHVVTLVVGGGAVLVANRNQWFFGDEWAFITRRGPHVWSAESLFFPHNDHWSTLPILIYKGLLATVGLRSYRPYALVIVVLHVFLTDMVWRASLRAGARPAFATGLAGVFAVLGAGSENLLWAFQIGFIGAIGFGWLAVLLHDHDGPFDRRDVGGWAANIVALMFSGPAVAMVGVATLTVALRRRRWRDTVLTAAAPLAVFGVWYLLYGHRAHRVPSKPGAEWTVVDWAWHGLTHAAEAVTGIPSSGALLVLVLLFWWATHLDEASGRASLAAAGVVGTVGLYLLTATGRVSLGLQSADAGRYVYIAAALLIPGAAYALSRVVPRSAAGTGVVLAFCGLLAFHNLGLLRNGASKEMAREMELRGTVVAAARLLREGPTVDGAPPGGRLNADLTAARLREVDREGWLPDDVTPSLPQELAAEVALQVALKPPTEPLGSVSLRPDGVDVRPAGRECLGATPLTPRGTVSLSAPAPRWRVRLTSTRGGKMLVRVGKGPVLSPPRVIRLPPAQRVDLVSVAKGRFVVLNLPSGTTTICAPGVLGGTPRTG
jgi:hypothetical protein